MGKTHRKPPSHADERRKGLRAYAVRDLRQQGKKIEHSAVRGGVTSPVRLRNRRKFPIDGRGGGQEKS